MDELKYRCKFLQDLTKLSKADRKKYLAKCSSQNIEHISEAAYNILHVCPCKPSVKKKVKLFDKQLKKLANEKTSVKAKRKLLLDNQTGDGIFSILLSTVLPFVIGLLSKKKKK